MAIGRRALAGLGARYPVVPNGSAPSLLRRWRCVTDGSVISSEDEYGRHIFLNPNHRIITLSST